MSNAYVLHLCQIVNKLYDFLKERWFDRQI